MSETGQKVIAVGQDSEADRDKASGNSGPENINFQLLLLLQIKASLGKANVD